MVNRKALVVGGAGYIGSHTNLALAEKGYDTVVVDNLVYGHENAVIAGEFVKGDISDPELLDSVFSQHKFDGVVHFAAYAYVGESVAEPEKYYLNNTSGTLNLLSAMRRHEVKNIVFSSTCATYGIPSTVPIVEDHPQNPINPYGSSKLMVERILSDYANAYDLRYCALRYFNAAGADPKGRLGERHDPETHLIPLALRSVTGDAPPLVVYGDDYPTPDGTCIRDYIHVCDLADAHVLALGRLIDGGDSDVYNLGVGTGVSVRQIIGAVESVTGKKACYSIGPRRAGDPPELVSDPSKALKVLGWEAAYKDILKTVETAWRWETSGKC